VSTDPIYHDEQVEFQSQQSQRRQQRFQSQLQVQHAGQEVWDLENQLDQWIGKCALCYVRGDSRFVVDSQHTLDECLDDEQALVVAEVHALEGIRFQAYAGCYECGVAQQICTRWDEVREGTQKFERVDGGVCQYRGVVRSAVAAMMVAGPVEVVDREVWSWMRAEGIWGVADKLSDGEEQEVKRRMLEWFGQKVVWGGVEASVLLQVFYRLAKGFEQWRREVSRYTVAV
jgi:hypothetical protein